MSDDTPKRVLIVGATSAIAEACARLWAQDGAQLYLIARNLQKLALVAADLQIRGATGQHQIAHIGGAIDHAYLNILW